MDNEQLAKAIVALYATIDLTNEWTDTDELIQLAAFGLWDDCTWDREKMADYLIRNGWNEDAACSFADTTPRELNVWRMYAPA